MTMKNRMLIALVFMTLTFVISSCGGHRDCQGNKHRVKTEMGGYL